jgi:hypothetical protein
VIRLGTCLVCGGEDVEIVGGMVEWLEPVDGVIWQHIERCVDRPACRARLELIPGERWPVNDRTPATVRAATDSEEVPAWL